MSNSSSEFFSANGNYTWLDFILNNENNETECIETLINSTQQRSLLEMYNDHAHCVPCNRGLYFPCHYMKCGFEKEKNAIRGNIWTSILESHAYDMQVSVMALTLLPRFINLHLESFRRSNFDVLGTEKREFTNEIGQFMNLSSSRETEEWDTWHPLKFLQTELGYFNINPEKQDAPAFFSVFEAESVSDRELIASTEKKCYNKRTKEFDCVFFKKSTFTKYVEQLRTSNMFLAFIGGCAACLFLILYFFSIFIPIFMFFIIVSNIIISLFLSKIIFGWDKMPFVILGVVAVLIGVSFDDQIFFYSAFRNREKVGKKLLDIFTTSIMSIFCFVVSWVYGDEDMKKISAFSIISILYLLLQIATIFVPLLYLIRRFIQKPTNFKIRKINTLIAKLWASKNFSVFFPVVFASGLILIAMTFIGFAVADDLPLLFGRNTFGTAFFNLNLKMLPETEFYQVQKCVFSTKIPETRVFYYQPPVEFINTVPASKISYFLVREEKKQITTKLLTEIESRVSVLDVSQTKLRPFHDFMLSIKNEILTENDKLISKFFSRFPNSDSQCNNYETEIVCTYPLFDNKES